MRRCQNALRSWPWGSVWQSELDETVREVTFHEGRRGHQLHAEDRVRKHPACVATALTSARDISKTHSHIITGFRVGRLTAAFVL